MGRLFIEHVENPITCKCGTHICDSDWVSFSKIESVDGDLISSGKLINVSFISNNTFCMLIKSRTVYLFDFNSHIGDKCEKALCNRCGLHIGFKIIGKLTDKFVIFIDCIQIV